MQRFKNILFVADNGPGQEQAFSRAMALAKTNQSKITVMDVVDDFISEQYAYKFIESSLKLLVKERRRSLQRLISAEAEKNPGVSIEIDIRKGRLFIEVIKAVLVNNHDLVMKAASSDMGRIHRVFGSMDIKLLRKCPCPIWIVKQSDHKHFARILAAVDPDPHNPYAEALNTFILDLATSLAEMENSELDVIHAWQVHGEVALRGGHSPAGTVDQVLDEMRDAHQKEMDKLLAPYSSTRKTVHLVKGDADDVVTELALKNNVDLVVMGTVGRSGVPGLIIGNTAEKVIHGIDCSVLAVKPEGFVSPVDT